MVALGEKLCCNDTKPRDGRVCRRQFAPSAGIPVRCTADILPGRCRRDKSGAVVEAYDTDAYGNTLAFTGPGADGVWFTDDYVQSNYGANEIIYQGRCFNPESTFYYFRTRYYSPAMGRFTNRNHWGYIQGRYGLYDFEKCNPTGFVEPFSVGIPVPGDGAIVVVVIIILGFLIIEIIRLALHTRIRSDCPPAPDPCPGLRNKLERARYDFGKAVYSFTQAENKLHGWHRPPHGSKEWWKDTREQAKALYEQLKIRKEIRQIRQAMRDNGC